jgi:hypothetical protein
MKTLRFLPLILATAAIAHADTLRTAKVSQAINQVTLYPEGSSARPAQTGDNITGSSSLQTGRRSRAEITFQDQTITRIGQNSVFSFRSGTRDLELQQGSVLLQVPKNAGGAQIRTATVTAAITGTTTMFEYEPHQWVKLITLEGCQKLFIKGHKHPVLVPAGQMIIMNPDGRVIPQPVIVDIARLLATSVLAGKGTFGPLPPKALSLIAQSIDQQKKDKNNGILLPVFFFSNSLPSDHGSQLAHSLGHGDPWHGYEPPPYQPPYGP